MKRFALGLLLVLALAAPSLAANRFLTCATTCTITAADTSIWGSASGGTGASVPGSSDAVILDNATCVGGTTCTATMGSGYNPSWVSLTMGTCTASTTGCVLTFSTNNNNITLQTFSGTGSGTRRLNMGNGLWTITNSGATPWDMSTVTNLTFNANSSTISMAGTGTTLSSLFGGGGLTYNIVSFGPRTNSQAPFTVGSANTFAGITLVPPVRVLFPLSTTQTISSAAGAATMSGTSSAQSSIGSSSASANATISVASGTPAISWIGLNGMTFSGGATFTAPNSFDFGGNTGITITSPAPLGSGGGTLIGG